MIDIMKRMQEHLEYARSQISEDYFGIFLFGSHNFGIGSEDSDVDTRYVYFSDKSEVGNYSELIPFEKEYIEAIEVRQFFLSLDSGSLSVVECLLTDFYIINPVYSQIWSKLRAQAEEIIRRSRPQIVKEITNMSKTNVKYFINNNGQCFNSFFVTKPILHLVRLEEVLYKIINLKQPREIFKSNLKPLAENIKTQRWDYKEAQALIFQTYQNILITSEKFLLFNNTQSTDDDLFWEYRIYPLIHPILKRYQQNTRKELTNE